ncbi:MAG TPA: 6-hydroxymethylpterin diphosphokinase MptE-like protein, partial [Parachlamydiaceae bacterium]|nr:6-hydroxymethylpterin diphosphokinase MptE-like protein [Parachlamydiaceae bacterium]
MKKQSARYKKNLELFARDNPLEAIAFRLDEATDCSFMKTCLTDENEPNLVDESGDHKIYLHAQYGAVLEAEGWAQKLALKEHDVLFIYGLGLGYYYLPLKKWLEENAARHLVFLEDNPCVVNHFLHTELATEILNNNQIIVRLLKKVDPNEAGWAELRLSESKLLEAFAFSNPYISALQSYFFSRMDFFPAFSLQWLNGLARVDQQLSEFYPHSPLVFHNFYANMMYLGETIPGYRMADALQNIPAVLCGAGPSLTKQFPLLAEISDSVLLMASGSAMNAVTQSGIIPHVGGAIDPTPAQASRQLTSFGFDVPAFYQNRFYDKAFSQWHGPLLY